MKSLLRDQRGQGLTEYIALLLLIAVVSLGVTKTLGKEIKRNIIQARENISKELTLEDSGSEGRRSGGLLSGLGL